MMVPFNYVQQEEEREDAPVQEAEVIVQNEDIPPSFIHTTFIHCPPTKVDLLGRVQIKDFLPRTIEEPGCVSDQFYRRVLKKKCTTEREKSASASASLSFSHNTHYYTYPDYPSEEELSLETKPHQILDLGRWIEREDFEEHLLMDFVCESLSKSLFEEFVNVLPILTTWNIRSLEVSDTITLNEEHHDDVKQNHPLIMSSSEDDEETKSPGDFSFARGTIEQIVINYSNNNKYDKDDLNKDDKDVTGIPNNEDDWTFGIKRKRTDSNTASTVDLYYDFFHSEDTTKSSNNMASSSSSTTLSSPGDSFQEALHSDAFSDKTERQAAMASFQSMRSSYSCDGPCCAWKQHCSVYWIKYDMEFVVTQHRTLKPNIPPIRRQQLLRMMREVALEKYGLISSDKNAKATAETAKDFTSADTSKTDISSGCMRYELLESDYHETCDEVLEIVTWRSSYDYERQQYKIEQEMPLLQRIIQNINSYFQLDKDNICYWETLVCE